jgi:predicted nucleic acid-binding protein
MNNKKVILDTGPLVAFLNKSDRYHEWAVIQFARLLPPFYTCEAVLSESCFLSRNYEKGVINIFQLLERGLLKIPFNLQDEFSAISMLLKKYKNVPISLADGCLVRMAEQITNSCICTLDSDFKIYRKDKRKIIPTLMPEDL